jgi:5-(carboxyamino)imidazole ribonucleotide synthase
VPAAALRQLAASRRVAPGADAVAVCQDRAAEKAQFVRCAVDCAPHALIESVAQLEAVDAALFPGILKTTRLGYDGRGQMAVPAPSELGAAWRALGSVPCVLEKRLALRGELSVIVARAADGQSVCLPVQRNLHRAGILAVTEVPAPRLAAATAARAVVATQRMADSLGYVGILCVEFFELDDGRLVANEMAPRPHNSGHYSIDACDVSQFELQVRTLTGAPLTAPRLHSAAVMLNLLGDLWQRQADGPADPDWASVLELPGNHLHLYGKGEARPGRKMGHLTITAASATEAGTQARVAAARLGIEAW